jgi:hypothetical protein
MIHVRIETTYSYDFGGDKLNALSWRAEMRLKPGQGLSVYLECLVGSGTEKEAQAAVKKWMKECLIAEAEEHNYVLSDI